MMLDIAEFESPTGAISLAVRDQRLCALSFTDRWQPVQARLRRRFDGVEFRRAVDPAKVVSRLRAYFAGELDALASLEVDTGGTPFQRQVWTMLRDVPPGRTVSYSDLAALIGAPRAVRAVGAANGANPIGIVIPCHRVIGADGTLVGYGGGMERKRWLLLHEGARFKEARRQTTDG